MTEFGESAKEDYLDIKVIRLGGVQSVEKTTSRNGISQEKFAQNPKKMRNVGVTVLYDRETRSEEGGEQALDAGTRRRRKNRLRERETIINFRSPSPLSRTSFSWSSHLARSARMTSTHPGKQRRFSDKGFSSDLAR